MAVLLAAAMFTSCSLAQCDRPVFQRGWCSSHFGRWKRHGDPLAPVRYERGTIAERFWPKVDKSGGCWTWRGSRNSKGYGWLGRGGARGGTALAHRVSWELHFGSIPPGVGVLHRCDNPPCVRPEHLWLGDARANLQDMAAKGRQVFQRHPERHHAKLTPANVAAARQEFSTARVSIAHLARTYGVAEKTMADALSGNTWRYVRRDA